MTEQLQPKYSILFSGELVAGTRREDALEKISQLTNLDSEELLEYLFSIKPVILTQTNEQALAQRYEEAFRGAGLNLTIAPYQESHDDILNVELSFGHYAPIERHESAPNFVIDPGTIESEKTSVASSTGSRFQLLFDGDLKTGMTKSVVLENLSHLTKREKQEVIEQLFSVVPVILLETSDQEFAISCQQDFESAGLSVRLESGGEIDSLLARSNLTIRNDAPVPPNPKTIAPFVYTLLSLSVVSILIWSTIYIFNQGYFDRDPAQVVHVRLNKTAAPANRVVSEPAKKEASEEKNTPVKNEVTEIPTPSVKPKSVPVPAPVPTAKSVPVSPAKTIANPEPNRKETVIRPALTDQQLNRIKEDYFIRLLNWFAQPQHHGYDSETRERNLQGDIKITITIDRDGNIKGVDILSSSSDELTQITRQSAYEASPYPPVPEEIEGPSYSFTLPLKYTLDKRD